MSTTETPVKQLKINRLTNDQYETAVKSDTELYLTPDTTDQDIANAISTHNSDNTAHSAAFTNKIDNSSITMNSSSKMQASGVKDVRTDNTLKTWTGTKQQYDAITTKDANTLYNITDDADSTSVASLLSQVQTQINNVYNSITSTVLDMVYPVGSIYLSVNNVNPATLFGGTWVQIKDTFLLAAGDTYSNGGTGGSADAVVVSHNHTQNAHSHKPASTSLKFLVSDTNVAINGTKRAFPASGTSAYLVYASDPGSGINENSTTQSVTATNIAAGVAATGKNMPPYLAVNIWRRES